MAKPFSYLIPNLSQGVSQQADAQRDPTQAEAQVNAVSSLSEGLRSRDCTVALAMVFSAPTPGLGRLITLSGDALVTLDGSYLVPLAPSGSNRLVTLSGDALVTLDGRYLMVPPIL